MTVKNYLFCEFLNLYFEKSPFAVAGRSGRAYSQSLSSAFVIGWKLPSLGDIKDGLLKMMLYTNLENVSIIDEQSFVSLPVLRLTSEKIVGEISSNSEAAKLEQFFRVNNFNQRQRELMQSLFVEAKENKFTISLGKI